MAVKCDNCETNALYTNSDPGVNPVNYCGICLPSWLKARADAGQFPLVQPINNSAPVIEEEEEEEVEEEVEEEEVEEEEEK